MSKNRVLAGLSAAAVMLAAGGALAGRPAAVVDDVAGNVANINFMDYVEVGKTISLGKSSSIELSYLGSCVHEKITGGSVIVGAEQSTVQGGEVERTKVACDGGNLLLANAESGKSGAAAFRAFTPNIPGHLPHVEVTLHSVKPMLSVGNPGVVSFTRLDKTGEPPIKIDVKGNLDLSKTPITLEPGAVYLVERDKQQLTVQIAKDARTQPGGPVLGRLIRF